MPSHTQEGTKTKIIKLVYNRYFMFFPEGIPQIHRRSMPCKAGAYDYNLCHGGFSSYSVFVKWQKSL